MKSGHQTWPSRLIIQPGEGCPARLQAIAKNLPAIAKNSVEGEATRPNLMSEVDLVV
jgi:hypothetical protein